MRSIWKGGQFDGRLTVTKVGDEVDALRRLIRRSPSRKTRTAGNAQWRPDKEWGDNAEQRAMKWLKNRGKKPSNVAHLNRGWDIECGEEKYEVKGRKSAKTIVRLTENEWRAASKIGRRYTILLITAPTEAKLARANPLEIADPAKTERWTRKATYEYFLNER